jgi:hypothetical protein
MSEILLNLLLISFSCIGYHLAGHEGFLLEKVARYFRDKYTDGGKNYLYMLGHTLINCPRCMASLHVVLFSPLLIQYFIFVPRGVLITEYILTGIGAVAFMNSVFINWFEKYL